MLPARFPNLLANGATGIAVGMATSIPPHNVGELCDALHPSRQATKRATVEELVEHGAGPGFPDRRRAGRGRATRSVEAYETGRGSFRLRARWESRRRSATGIYQIIVTEIPYQVQKSQPDRADRRAARGEEAAAPRRRPRRIGR